MHLSGKGEKKVKVEIRKEENLARNNNK